MRYLIVKNWRAHQHYKKRSPPWIKLHRGVIEDYAFSTLRDCAKAHLILIWVLAAGTEGRIPHDAKFIAKKISAADPVDLDAMILAGFLISDGAEPVPEPRVRNALIPDAGGIIERIPMIGGTEFDVHQSFVDELTRLYPAVDIPATLRQMRGWCIGNPAKLKTPRGIRKFITGWCERDQNGA